MELNKCYLIIEETTVFNFGTSRKEKVIGYFKANNEEEARTFCDNKTEALKGTYNENRVDKRYIYKEIEEIK